MAHVEDVARHVEDHHPGHDRLRPEHVLAAGDLTVAELTDAVSRGALKPGGRLAVAQASLDRASADRFAGRRDDEPCAAELVDVLA